MAEDLQGYVEHSPSGDGVHAIGYGRRFSALGSNKTGIEAYCEGRYFTVTGRCSGLGEPVCLADYVEQILKPLHTVAHVNGEKCTYEEVNHEVVKNLRLALLYMRSDDRELWIRIGLALKTIGDNGRALWLEWSATSEAFDPLNDAKTWDSFKPERTGYATVFAEAMRNGWINPNKKYEEEKIEGEEKSEWLNADDMADSATAPVYLIDNIIESRTHGLIAGSSQSFKSFCALKMAHSICTGNDFFGHDVFDTGKVLYICGEGLGALGRRIKALKIVYGDFNNNFFVLNRPLFIDNIAEMRWLKESIDKINPVFVIFDTFSSLATSTKENVNEEVARVLRMVADCCIDVGASSAVVHHYGKDAEKGTRGASAFSANVDYEISMIRTIDTMNAVMSCKKSKDGDYFVPIDFTAHVVDLGLIRQNGDPSSSLVLKKSLGKEKKEPSYNENDILLIETFRDYEEGGVLSYKYFRDLCLDKMITTNGTHEQKKSAFHNSRKKLIDIGIINISDDSV
jgi:hypothetical protein